MDPYIGEIRLFAGNYAPNGWAFCQGQTLQIYAYQALYSIIGGTYGYTSTTFNLPNLQGCALIHQGQGVGLTQRVFSKTGGESSVQLESSQMPNHSHVPNGITSNSTTDPTGAIWGGGVGGGRGTYIYANDKDGTEMNAMAINTTGGGYPHNNLQPFVAINYIIALEGVYPVKSS